MCDDVTTDGLDSAGCSPKDDEDDDSDDELPETCGAAAMKPNKISPASGYHAGSSYYFPMSKAKSWLARCDDRQHHGSTENNSSCLEQSDDSYYNRYQLRHSDDSTPAGRGFSANSDAVMERMMRRKEARRQRESANMTTADSVAGYRGRDCSIEELMEYIDAKPPTVPKSGQRRTGNRKKRKKKRSSNRPAQSDNGNVRSTTPVGSSRKPTEVDTTSPQRSVADTVAAADGGTASGNEHERCLSLGGDKVDSESMSELPLRCDKFFEMLPSDGSSSNTSDADVASDSRIDGGFGNFAQSSGDYRELVEMPSSGVGSPEARVGDVQAAKLDSEPVTESSKTANSDNVDEFGSRGCKQSNNAVSDKEATLDSENLEENRIYQTDAKSQGDETIAQITENCCPSVSSSSFGASADAVVDSANGGHVIIQRRHSEGFGCTTVSQQIACQSSESVSGSRKVCSTNTGQSTPSSSISDTRDSLDFDSQSLADELSSDFDFCAPTTSHESDFTVVTQKKKKKPTKLNAGSAGCLRRTFYNRNHQAVLAPRDWQSQSRNESIFRESTTVPSTVPVSCSSVSNNLELRSMPVGRETGTPLEIAVSIESVESLLSNERTRSDVDRVLYASHTVTNAMLDHAAGASSCGETNSRCITSLSAESSHRTALAVKDVTRSSADNRTEEKLFLDTRRPHVGVTPAPAFSELSFWYDTTISENQSTTADTDTPTLTSPYNIAEPGENADVSLVTSSTSFANFPTGAVITSLASSATSTVIVTTHLYVNSCTSPAAVSLQLAAGDSSVSVSNASLLPTPDGPIGTLVAHSVQTYVQPLLSRAPDCYVTSTSAVSSSSRDAVNNHTRSGTLVVSSGASTALSQSAAVVSASATDSVRQPSGRSHQRFDLRDAQLFLYNG